MEKDDFEEEEDDFEEDDYFEEEEDDIKEGENESEYKYEDDDEDEPNKDERALTLAEHLRQDPKILESFKPSALRNVVNNPSSLSILPIKVIDRIINDPIFSVHLPRTSLEKITKLLLNQTASDDDPTYQDLDYYDYDLDYGDLNEVTSSFVGDLDPEFIRGIDPEII